MSYTLEGRTGAWEVVIGLEVHAQVISKSKLFSGAATAFGAEPNTQVSFVDAAFPGMLPVINRECVAQAVRTGLACNAQINLVSRFDRKNYFYADLPAGYQISQYEHPIVGKGEIEIELRRRQHQARSASRGCIWSRTPASRCTTSTRRNPIIDLNRAGVALMEIVVEPDMRSPEEAGAYLRKLRSILRYLGTCDGNMEEGSMRADVNVSVRKPGEAIPHALRDEERQLDPLRHAGDRGRGAAPDRGVGGRRRGASRRPGCSTAAAARRGRMRSKEDAHDYRYFPDPDLLPLVLDAGLGRAS